VCQLSTRRAATVCSRRSHSARTPVHSSRCGVGTLCAALPPLPCTLLTLTCVRYVCTVCVVQACSKMSRGRSRWASGCCVHSTRRTLCASSARPLASQRARRWSSPNVRWCLPTVYTPQPSRAHTQCPTFAHDIVPGLCSRSCPNYAQDDLSCVLRCATDSSLSADRGAPHRQLCTVCVCAAQVACRRPTTRAGVQCGPKERPKQQRSRAQRCTACLRSRASRRMLRGCSSRGSNS
jgi:hypothetical protein